MFQWLLSECLEGNSLLNSLFKVGFTKRLAEEQRLGAAGDRLEKVFAPSLEALRTELRQQLLAERSEAEQRFDHLARQLKDLAEANEEAVSEVREVQASTAGVSQATATDLQ